MFDDPVLDRLHQQLQAEKKFHQQNAGSGEAIPSPDGPVPERPHWQWKPGQSGNPRGRPKGAKNKRRALAEALLDSESLELAKLALGFAAEGDKVMLRACLTRAVAPARGRAVRVRLTAGMKPWDIIAALLETQERMMAGIITPQEARDIASFLNQRLTAYETWLRTRKAEREAGLVWPEDNEDEEDEDDEEDREDEDAEEDGGAGAADAAEVGDARANAALATAGDQGAGD